MQKMKSWRSSRSTEPSDDYPSTVEFSLSSGAEEAVPGRDEGYLAFLNFLSADSAHNEKGAATNGGKGGKAPLHRILEEQLNGTCSYTSSHDIYDKAFPEEEIYDADCYVGNHYSSRPSNLTEEEEGKTRQMNVNSATPPKRNMRRKLSALGGMDPLPQAQTTDGQDSGYEEIRAAFENEHKAVRKFKIVVVLVLVAAAIAVSAIVYRFTSRGEENTMVMEYADYADKFITNFHHLQVTRQWAAYTIAAMFTAKSVEMARMNSAHKMPNITLYDFQYQVRGAIALAHAINIEFSPLFENEEEVRSGWEAYAVENEEIVTKVPEWANAHAGGGHGDGAAGDADDYEDMGEHSTTEDSGNSTMSEGDHSNTEDAEHSSMEEEHSDMNIDMDMGNHTFNAELNMDTGEGEFDPDMNSSVEMAMANHVDMNSTNMEPQSLLRRKLPDYNDASEGHAQMEQSSVHNNVFGMTSEDQSSSESSEECVSINEKLQVHHSHPKRPFEQGIYTMDGVEMIDETSSTLHMPLLAPAWHVFPLLGNEGRLMFNEYSDCHRRRAVNTMLKTGGPALTEVLLGDVDSHHYFEEPSSIMVYPVNDNFDEGKNNVVGFVSIVFSWIRLFWNILPENVRGIVVVIETSTGQKTSFRADGKHGIFLGEGDYHDEKWDHMKKSSNIFRAYAKENDVKEMEGHHRHLEGRADHITDTLSDGEHIDYMVHVYPSDDFKNSYITNQPRIFSLAVSLVFLVTTVSFIVYDILVERRQKKLLDHATRSGKIVSSLFPAMVRDRLFNNQTDTDHEERTTIMGNRKSSAEMKRLKKFMVPHPPPSGQQSQTSDSDTAMTASSPPIADLYNDTTIMFADIAGFTAWSSEREPTQVFQLLESLFCEFDSEAKAMKVFKIETIGDCYVAVTGLPEPNPDHAVVMAKFAQCCLQKFGELTKELELSLGPGTAELGLRVGLHSGPVTAGVLRGEKARFQLFGDTMNTASRMESTSIKNMIQVSSDTAKYLRDSGKEGMLIPREGLVKAKGKGYMQTFWLRPSTPSTVSSRNTEVYNRHEADHIHSMAQYVGARSELGLPSLTTTQKALSESWNDTDFAGTNGQQGGWDRLIKWNTAVLESILIKIVIQRHEQRKKGLLKPSKHNIQYDNETIFHEEIAKAVEMPKFGDADMSTATLMPTKDKVNLIPANARMELRVYVARIASLYNDVHFHSFEHASHVTMSAQKLINKMVLRNGEGKKDAMQKSEEADLFFGTYGISADPLAQFAVVFAALVHDVDHRGVPNVQLSKEEPSLASKYKSKSVAENNSICIAWNELFQPEFYHLRGAIFGTDEDESRFRQLLINVVIATDITDRERRAGERERWEAAFRNDSGSEYNWEKEWQNNSDRQLPTIDVSLKATVVLEQIVLASDVAHTMQHWLTYVKWNERLYKEMWAAYKNGRAEKDPTEGWYKGEIGFFDGYIIPLATKLKECGVFGNAGDEYLGNALRNKAEWIEKGQAIVEEFEAKIKRKSNGGSSFV